MSPTKQEQRNMLLTLCERGFVRQTAWANRDSSAAQRQLGECYALLKAGCDFVVQEDDRLGAYWVTVWFQGFNWFEGGFDYDENRDRYLSEERFYVPTEDKLRDDGGDWY